MIIKTKEFQKACKTILAAIDNNSKTVFAKTLELVATDKELKLNVTNREYYVSVKFNLDHEENFRAAVNATKFLKLISKITTDELELLIDKKFLKVIANGNYTVPLVFDDDKLLELPNIALENITSSQVIDSNILNSIAVYNGKEMRRGTGSTDTSRYYYVDNNGAITFTTGACVNEFSLDSSIAVLLTDPVVQLFKLFESNCKVNCNLGVSENSNVFTPKIELLNDSVRIAAILIGMSDPSIMAKYPVKACRKLAEMSYPYTAIVNSNDILSALDRLSLFVDEKNKLIKLSFSYDGSKSLLTIGNEDDNELIPLENDFTDKISEYTTIINSDNLISIISDHAYEFITMNFGVHKAIAISHGTITDILPEGNI